ncbi:MAG: MurR/RpiR family transcriptional regulator [Desulfobacteraceae bacterium]|nr:MurR/RpiR family transcriptional regulator [Desulfobacteraceae bacterium]
MYQEDVLAKIRRQFPYLQPALKKIAHHILEQPEIVKLQKISEVARACEVSEATVTRLVRTLQFKNFPELKIALAEVQSADVESKKEEQTFSEYISKNDSFQSAITKVTFKNIQSLQNTLKLISLEQVENGISAIDNADTVVIFCAGTSIVAGQTLKLRFQRIGKNCFLHTDLVEQAVTASLLTPKSLAIGISSSGRTKTVVDAMRIAKSSGAKTLCITDSSDSPIVPLSDIQFFTLCNHSDFLQDSLLSRMSQLLMIDILFVCFFLRHYDDSLKLVEKSARSIKKATKDIFL